MSNVADPYPITYNVHHNEGGQIVTTAVGTLKGSNNYCISMQQGDEVALTFFEPRDGGYTWKADLPKEAKESIEMKEGTFPKPSNALIQGGSSQHSFILTLLGNVPDMTPIHFVLQRAWEEKAQAERTIYLVPYFTARPYYAASECSAPWHGDKASQENRA